MKRNSNIKDIWLLLIVMIPPILIIQLKDVHAAEILQPKSEVVVNNPNNPVPVAVVGQNSVTVSNTPNVNVTNSVHVSGTVNIGLVPYQHQRAIPDSTTCAPHCQLPDFPKVPEGKRLVITFVSAELQRVGTDAVVMEGNGSTVFVTKPYQNSRYISAAVTSYYESGQTPTARMFVEDELSHTPLIVTLSGYLIPSQLPHETSRAASRIHRVGRF